MNLPSHRKPTRKNHRALLSVFSLIVLCPPVAEARQTLLTPTKPPADQTEARVNALLKQMTLEEEIDLIAGTGFGTHALPRLNLPAFNMTDGPGGVRSPGPSTAFAAGIGLAATWNPTLAEEVGKQIGRDARSRGMHFLLGPGVNLYRSPLNGRNFEYFGEDPFLGARIAVGYTQGVQSQRVSATIKHFLGNNSEFARNTSNTVLDERTARELYLPIFEAAVKEANVGAIMDAYNLTNGAYMTQNGYFNTEVAKNGWGFGGVMMSDWFATHDAIGAVNGGMDLEMPFGQFLNRGTLLPAIEAGKVSKATIDDKVRRILRLAVRFGWLDGEQSDPLISRYNQGGRAAALEGARQGIVLLKNQNDLLPLDRNRVKTIAVIGPNGYPAVPAGGGSGNVAPFAGVSFLTGISDALGTKGNVVFARGLPTLDQMARATRIMTTPTGGKRGLIVETFDNPQYSGTPVSIRTEGRVNSGRSFFANLGSDDAPPFEPEEGGVRPPFRPLFTRWTGYYTPKSAGSHSLFVESTDNYRVKVDGKVVLDGSEIVRAMVNAAHFELTPEPHKIVIEQAKRTPFGAPFIRMGIAREGSLVEEDARALAAKADVVIVAVGFNAETETEGSDRAFSLPPGQEELIRAMSEVNKKTVVVLTSGGSVEVAPWLDRVSGLLEAWYPGQEGGKALAEILFGDATPSGRLPISWETREEDNPASGTYYYTEPGTNKIEYKEGVFVGYRGYEHNHIKPLFPFGFGLSYTTFRYGRLSIKPLKTGTGSAPFFEVSFDVTNTGPRAGAEVAQVYVSDTHATVARPPRELKGFARVELRPGATQRVKIVLNGRAFTYYDVKAKGWHAEAGDFNILVGRSAEQTELRGKITLSAPLDIPVGN